MFSYFSSSKLQYMYITINQPNVKVIVVNIIRGKTKKSGDFSGYMYLPVDLSHVKRGVTISVSQPALLYDSYKPLLTG